MNPQYQASTLCRVDMSPLTLFFEKQKQTEQEQKKKRPHINLFKVGSMFLDKRWVSLILHHLLTKSQVQAFRFKGIQKRNSLHTPSHKKIKKEIKKRKGSNRRLFSPCPSCRPIRADWSKELPSISTKWEIQGEILTCKIIKEFSF